MNIQFICAVVFVVYVLSMAGAAIDAANKHHGPKKGDKP